MPTRPEAAGSIDDLSNDLNRRLRCQGFGHLQGGA